MNTLKCIIVLAVCCFYSFTSFAQLKKVSSTSLKVNYTQTIHLVFDTPLKYYKSVNDFVICDNPKEVPNILRIKANKESFDTNTNVSVAGEDGRFYSFDVSYQDFLDKTVEFVPKDTIYSIEQIGVSNTLQTHIVAPDGIIYIDYGDDCVRAEKAENTENILRIQANKEFEGRTNVSFATKKGRFYSFNLKYEKAPSVTLYSLDSGENQPVILSDNKLNSRERELLLDRLSELKPSIYDLAIRKNEILFRVNNIISYDDIILLDISIENKSSIPYDIDYIRYAICDKKRGKLTAYQEIDYPVLFHRGYKPRIENKNRMNYIVAFNKFTLSDDKLFRIEINEQKGGRHILLDILPHNIEKCVQLE